MVIAIGEDGKILLQKEYSYPPNETLYQFPGGAIEKNETPEKAAIRELAEEAKLKGELEYLGWFYVENRRTKAMLHVFLATQLETVDSGQDIEEEAYINKRIGSASQKPRKNRPRER
jgi:ADP-ribose pyrophosphatase YjhB (NUDIX family)